MDFGARKRIHPMQNLGSSYNVSPESWSSSGNCFKMFVAARLDGFYTSWSLDKQHDCLTPFMDIGLLPTRSAKHQDASGPCSFRAH